MLQWPGSALLDRKDTHRLLTQVGDILMLRSAIICCGRRRIIGSGFEEHRTRNSVQRVVCARDTMRLRLG